jgi:hypothetical protein
MRGAEAADPLRLLADQRRWNAQAGPAGRAQLEQLVLGQLGRDRIADPGAAELADQMALQRRPAGQVDIVGVLVIDLVQLASGMMCSLSGVPTVWL